jgi:hypothetical protein
MPNLSLAFSMQPQAQPNWCWAAVAASVASFYKSTSSHTQCKIVNAVLRSSTCCSNGSTPSCNIPASLEDALNHLCHCQKTSSGAEPWAVLDKELCADQPVGVLIKLLGGSGHFLVIVGNRTSSSDLIITEDPYHGRSTVKHSNLSASAHGIWQETYLTQP